MLMMDSEIRVTGTMPRGCEADRLLGGARCRSRRLSLVDLLLLRVFLRRSRWGSWRGVWEQELDRILRAVLPWIAILESEVRSWFDEEVGRILVACIWCTCNCRCRLSYNFDGGRSSGVERSNYESCMSALSSARGDGPWF
jgi:hypothetical protein